MSDAHVLELDALNTLRTGLFRFGAEVENAVLGALQAATSVVNAVASKEESARAEVRRWTEKVVYTEKALQHCRRQDEADCSGLVTQLALLRRQLERKVEILRALQETRRQVDESVQQFARSAQRMRGALREHIDLATTKLQTWGNVLETYATGSVPSGTATPSTIPLRRSRSGWGTASAGAAAALVGVLATSPARWVGTPTVGSEWRSAGTDFTAGGFSSARWSTTRSTIILTDDSVRHRTEPHDTATLDSVAATVGAGPGVLTAVVYRARDSKVSLYERTEPGTQWTQLLGPTRCEDLLDSPVQMPQHGERPGNMTVVAPSRIELPGSFFASCADAENRASLDDICAAWRIWEDTVAPAVRSGARRDFFRLLDEIEWDAKANYEEVYDSFYCEDAIRVQPLDGDRYLVSNGVRRVLGAQHLGLDTIPVVVVAGGID